MIGVAILLVAVSVVASPQAPPRQLPTPQEMAAAREDLWGDAAIRASGGPQYEFFKDLLPPLRYVDTGVRHYPIVLSAPGAAVKARWISNGGGINLRANKPPMWREIGIPVAFFVGSNAEPFGANLGRLDGPRYVSGYLPILQIAETMNGVRYEQEIFAAVDKAASEQGAVLVRFTIRGGAGRMTIRVGSGERLRAERSVVKDEKGGPWVHFGSNWKWADGANTLTADLAVDQSADVMVLAKPVAEPEDWPAYDEERRRCIDLWTKLLDSGVKLSVPEPIVQDAWRALIVGQYLIAVGDRMHYSAGNAYDHLYEGECGDAVRSTMLFGRTADARRMVGPLLDFNRQATRYHVAGHKLQLLAHYYWITRDRDYLHEKRTVWRPVIDFIRTSRKTENGLLPKDRYAGDIAEAVYSLSSNANCWRGLRDMAAVLEDIGEVELAAELKKEAAEFRKAILAAVEKSIRRESSPPFVPIALLADEPAHDPLTATRKGSYYDLMIPYVLGSGVFGPGANEETWIIDYLRRHGGLAMGMIRSTPHQGQFKGEPGVNVLYGLRYMQTILRRGDRSHALAGFYGHLAHGMTRETFIGGEGSRFFHGDRHGRSFYLPPNSASNAMFLTTLRSIMVQDLDLDDDGKPETLRLLDAIPPHWLGDGASLVFEKAPTAFGEASVRVESRLKDAEVVVNVETPPRPIGRLQLRLPDPPGRHINTVWIDGVETLRDVEGRIDLPRRAGKTTIRFRLDRASGH
jgi:hypothetical protein